LATATITTETTKGNKMGIVKCHACFGGFVQTSVGTKPCPKCRGKGEYIIDDGPTIQSPPPVERQQSDAAIAASQDRHYERMEKLEEYKKNLTPLQKVVWNWKLR
jgi:hypothetical protein